MSYAMLLRGWWALAISAVLAVLWVMVTRAACRARGVCEGWTRSAMTRRDRISLGGPAAVAAALVFMLWAGTGLTLSARAARR